MTFLNLIAYIGTPAILAALIYIGRKLQVLDTLQVEMVALKQRVDSLYERFIKMEERVEALWMEKFAGSAK